VVPVNGRAGGGRDPAETATRRLALVLFAVAFGTNVPTPLLLVYRGLLDLPATSLAAIFGVYAAGLLPALLLAGPASDRLGRRPVTVPFVVLSAVASLLFVPAAGSVPLLYLGRFLQGIVSGVVFSVGSAWLAELSGDATRAARRAGVALSSGWALGPLTSGVVAEVAGGTAGGFGVTVLPYLIHVAVMAPAVVALSSLPETRPRALEPRPLLNLGVPRQARLAFWTFVAPAAVFVFAYPSLSLTVMPLFLAEEIAGIEVAVTGVVAGVTLLVGALVSGLAAGVSARWGAAAGAACGACGLVVALAADATGVWPLLVLAAALLGGGYGLCLASGLASTERLADPEHRGALTATFYACAYSGFAAPYLVSLAASGGTFADPLAALAVGAVVLAGWLGLGPGGRALATAGRRPEVPGRHSGA
jgi:MFS family permease